MLPLSPLQANTRKVDRPNPELSDVPCYTCRRRHVKCDRILPNCAKCAKKGVPCAGYRKPLRWADGVAVRGKLKGKIEPTVDDQAISIAQSTAQAANASAREEVERFGITSFDKNSLHVTKPDRTFLELIAYYNTKLAVEQDEWNSSPIQTQKLAQISPEVAKGLPRDIMNCLLGIAVVHMAVRSPSDRQIERLALETKVNIFQSVHHLFQHPQKQRADVLLTCINLLFAMDVIENGLSRWDIHFQGALKLLATSDGVEEFASFYPHLRPTLAFILQLDTMYPALSPISHERPIVYTRNWFKTICFNVESKGGPLFICPLYLARSMNEMAVCGQNISRAQGQLSAADLYTREWILSDVLQYQPQEGMRYLKERLFSGRELSAFEAETWNLVFTAWKSAIAVLVVRHLYFGLPDFGGSFQFSRSPTPTMANQTSTQPFRYDNASSGTQETTILQEKDILVDIAEMSRDSNQPTSGLNPVDQYSPQLSPLPSPRQYNDSMTFDFWNRRYEIHNKAFSDLHHSLVSLLEPGRKLYLRYAFLPLVILALASRSGSSERMICMRGFEEFQASAKSQVTAPSPIGGGPLSFDIPWERLDAYSAEVEQERNSNVVFVEAQLHNSAPEWNWSSMLERIDLKLIWPVGVGTMFTELGSDYWAFNIMSTCCTTECFDAFVQSPSSSARAST